MIQVNNWFLLSDLTTHYFLSLLFSFVLIIVNSDWNLNLGSDLRKNSSISALCVSVWRSKCICYLVDTMTVLYWLQLAVTYVNLKSWIMLSTLKYFLWLSWERGVQKQFRIKGTWHFKKKEGWSDTVKTYKPY